MAPLPSKSVIFCQDSPSKNASVLSMIASAKIFICKCFSSLRQNCWNGWKVVQSTFNQARRKIVPLMGNPWVKSSALIMPQILQSRLSERTANCSLTLENKNQTHLRVQWVVFLAFLLSQSDLESSVSSTLSSPPRIDSPSGRIFFCFSFCFQEGKGQGKSVPPKKIALNSKAYRGNWCHWWSASFPAMLRDLLAFLGLLWSHFGSFWYLLLKPSDTSLLEAFFCICWVWEYALYPNKIKSISWI